MKQRPNNLIAALCLGLLLAPAGLLAACAVNTPVSSGSGQTAPAPTGTPTPTPEPTPIPYSLDIYETDDTPDLYDLSDFVLSENLESFLHPIPMGAGGDTDVFADEDLPAPDARCAGVGMFSEHEILMVVEDNGFTYQCVIFDTDEGTYRTYHAPWERFLGEAQADEATPDKNPLHILSVSPVVIYDSNASVIYRPQSEDPEKITCPLNPEQYERGSISVANGEVYLSTWSGFLYHLEEDGSETQIWTLPEDYIHCYPVEDGVEDVLTFRTYLLAEREREIFVEFNPETGETSARETTAAYSSTTVSSDDTLCTLNSEETPTVNLWNTAENTEKTLSIPGSVILFPSYLGDQYVRLAPIPIIDDALLLTRVDSESYVSALFYWETGEVSSEESDRDPGTPFEILPVDYGGPSARAAEMSETYDVSIHIGENAPTSFSTYTAGNSTDAWTITLALDALDQALAKYPPGYFTQLQKDMYREIRIELVGPMTPIQGDQYIGGPSAVTFEDGGIVQLAFDIEAGVQVGTVCHELTHVFDYRMENLGLLDEGAWAAMNPEDFDYFYAYIDEEGNEYQNYEDLTWTAASDAYWAGDYDSVYFMDNYAKTYPTEDRARIIESLSDPSYVDPCFRGVHMREKANYLFSLMREVFDTTGWPEKLSWEEMLESA